MDLVKSTKVNRNHTSMHVIINTHPCNSLYIYSYYMHIYHQYIKIFVVCLSGLSVRPDPSVRNGNGRGFSLKLLILRLQRAARYVRHATVGACRRTSNRQEHKIIQRAGPEQDTIFHLHVTACRRRGSHRQDHAAISLGSFTGTGYIVLQLVRLESLGSELQDS